MEAVDRRVRARCEVGLTNPREARKSGMAVRSHK
jgi:hypothetical protein